MRVSMGMGMRVTMRMRLGRCLGMLLVKLLGQGVILGERFFTPMPVTAAVCTRFRFKRFVSFFDVRSQPDEHIPQYRVGFKAKVAGADLDRRVPVSQVIRRPGELQVVRGGCHQNGLRRGFHADEIAPCGLQPGTWREDRAARQQDGEFRAILEGDELAGFPALLVRELYHVGRDRARRQRGQHGVGLEHLSSTSDQNRK